MIPAVKKEELAIPVVWPAHTTSTLAMARPRILIVDDSEIFRTQLSTWLSSAGFVVSTAKDGEKGLETLDQSGRFDLAFVDFNMPRMNGIEMIEELVKRWATNPNPDRKATKLVMLTAENGLDLVVRAQKSGILGWLIKPTKEEHVVKVARKLTGFGLSAAESPKN